MIINRLSNRCGIKGSALNWFQSYLSERIITVPIGSAHSNIEHLMYGVTQGYVLGPILFSICNSPLGEIITKYNVKYHFNADDGQLYLSFQSNILSQIKQEKK